MRLTQEIKVRGHKTYQFSNGKKASQGLTKLGKLEDIEEELGIDLITLFKALKDGDRGYYYYKKRKYGRKRK